MSLGGSWTSPAGAEKNASRQEPGALSNSGRKKSSYLTGRMIEHNQVHIGHSRSYGGDNRMERIQSEEPEAVELKS